MQHEPRKSKPDNSDSLSERLQERAAANPIAKSKNVLRELIEARDTLAELRAEGRSSEKIQELLEAEQVHATAGTIRNYRAQIHRAIEALELDGNSDPTDDEIHQMVIRLAAAASCGKSGQKSTSGNDSHRHVQTKRPTSTDKIRRKSNEEESDRSANTPKSLGTFEIKSDRDNL